MVELHITNNCQSFKIALCKALIFKNTFYFIFKDQAKYRKKLEQIICIHKECKISLEEVGWC